MPEFIIPARNARHRAACFALYKALLRLGARVPLDDAAAGAVPVPPIKHHIRNAFRRNKNDTSPRLVVAALHAGYKFLDLLTKAQIATSPENASICTFLRGRHAQRAAHFARLEAHPPRPKPTTNRIPGTIPLLRLARRGVPAVYAPDGSVIKPAVQPVFEPVVRPLKQARLGGLGIRRVPTLAETSGLPFLRINKKPQPQFLARVLHARRKVREQRFTRMRCIREHDVPEAQAEDEWERLMGKLLPSEKRRVYTPGSFEQSALMGYYDHTEKMRMETMTNIARGKALWELVEAEQQLADKEAAEREKALPENRKQGGKVEVEPKQQKEERLARKITSC